MDWPLNVGGSHSGFCKYAAPEGALHKKYAFFSAVDNCNSITKAGIPGILTTRKPFFSINCYEYNGLTSKWP